MFWYSKLLEFLQKIQVWWQLNICNIGVVLSTVIITIKCKLYWDASYVQTHTIISSSKYKLWPLKWILGAKANTCNKTTLTIAKFSMALCIQLLSIIKSSINGTDTVPKPTKSFRPKCQANHDDGGGSTELVKLIFIYR